MRKKHDHSSFMLKVKTLNEASLFAPCELVQHRDIYDPRLKKHGILTVNIVEI